MTAPPVTTAQSSSPPVPAPPSNSDGSHPPPVEGARGTGDPPQGGAVSTAVAAAAAAKLNAMLASQGKLLKSDPPLAKVRKINDIYTLYMYTVHVHACTFIYKTIIT